MPTHNRAGLLPRAIESVLNQTYKNIELIVVDDGSTDNTQVILKKYADSDKRFKFFTHEQPKGACAARNLAIMKSSAEFITGLDDDDCFKENRIEEFINSYHPKYSFLCSGYQVITTTSSELIYKKQRRISFKKILHSNIVGNQCFTERKRILNAGCFDENLPAWQDYDLWIRLMRLYGSSKRIASNSYVIDKSHSHERITKNRKKISAAYSYFLKEHREYQNNNFRKSLHLTYHIATCSDLDLKFIMSVISFSNSFRLAAHVCRHIVNKIK